MRASLIATALAAVGLITLAPAVDAQTLKKIADTNKITVSYRESAVPFSYAIGPGKAVGFAADLSAAIVDDVRKTLGKSNLEVVFIPVTGQNRISLLVDGTYDLECGSTTNTSARGKDVAFTINHFYTGTRVLTKKTSNIKGYADLAKKTVVATGGSTNEKVIRKYAADNNLDLAIVLAKDYADGFRMVENDTAVAFALDDVLLYGLAATARDPAAYEVVGETLSVEPYACMVRKDDPEFKKLADGTIARLMKSGGFTTLYAKWFESPIPPEGVVLRMPMSEPLKANLTALSDRPAQ
ncbi:MAG: transporter substrate-binding domain-containing protein [Burkholderiales bacterium]